MRAAYYRCSLCRTTSPKLYGRRDIDAALTRHREDFHGGHIPDGEQIIPASRSGFTGLPLEQRVAAAVLAAIVVLIAVSKLT